MGRTDQKKSDKSETTSEKFLKNLSELTVEKKVEELAALFFTITEIALYIDMDAEQLRNIIVYEKESEISKAYNKGKLQTRILLRFDSRDFALKGSPQALQEMKEYLADQQIDEDA